MVVVAIVGGDDDGDDGRMAKALDLALLMNGHCARYRPGSVQCVVSQEDYSAYFALAEQKHRLQMHESGRALILMRTRRFILIDKHLILQCQLKILATLSTKPQFLNLITSTTLCHSTPRSTAQNIHTSTHAKTVTGVSQETPQCHTCSSLIQSVNGTAIRQESHAQDERSQDRLALRSLSLCPIRRDRSRLALPKSRFPLKRKSYRQNGGACSIGAKA